MHPSSFSNIIKSLPQNEYYKKDCIGSPLLVFSYLSLLQDVLLPHISSLYFLTCFIWVGIKRINLSYLSDFNFKDWSCFLPNDPLLWSYPQEYVLQYQKSFWKRSFWSDDQRRRQTFEENQRGSERQFDVQR